MSGQESGIDKFLGGSDRGKRRNEGNQPKNPLNIAQIREGTPEGQIQYTDPRRQQIEDWLKKLYGKGESSIQEESIKKYAEIREEDLRPSDSGIYDNNTQDWYSLSTEFVDLAGNRTGMDQHLVTPINALRDNVLEVQGINALRDKGIKTNNVLEVQGINALRDKGIKTNNVLEVQGINALRDKGIKTNNVLEVQGENGHYERTTVSDLLTKGLSANEIEKLYQLNNQRMTNRDSSLATLKEHGIHHNKIVKVPNENGDYRRDRASNLIEEGIDAKIIIEHNTDPECQTQFNSLSHKEQQHKSIIDTLRLEHGINSNRHLCIQSKNGDVETYTVSYLVKIRNFSVQDVLNQSQQEIEMDRQQLIIDTLRSKHKINFNTAVYIQDENKNGDVYTVNELVRKRNFSVQDVLDRRDHFV